MAVIPPELDADIRKGDSHFLQCVKCQNSTYHTVVASQTLHQKWEEIEESDDYEIIRCDGCRSVSFRRYRESTEDLVYDPQLGEGVLLGTEELYPERRAERPVLKGWEHLPTIVLRIYKETLSAISSQQRTLAGMGIRALVEAVCIEEDAKGKNLEKRIDALVAKGKTTQSDAEILHSTRLLGNKAAHEIQPLTSEALDQAVQMVEHLLQGVYILPATTSALPRRPPRSPAAPSVPPAPPAPPPAAPARPARGRRGRS